MNIFPAIDLYGGKAVRLYKGDYAQLTVYSDTPVGVACDFAAKGAKFIHVVDLEGAKSGETPNFETVLAIKRESGLFCEVGGGIRSMEVIDRYLTHGIDRVILGTAAVANEDFVKEAVAKYGDRIAVGADVKDGYIAIKGWTAKSEYTLDEFFAKMQTKGVKTVICTDISRDGAMRGTNLEMYKKLSQKYTIDIIASGGVSSLDDIRELRKMELYGAIIGKAYYTGAIDLGEAIKEAKNDNEKNYSLP